MSPLLWGFIGLVTAAVALSGRLDVIAAKWVLVVAWLMAVFSIYRFEPILRQSGLPRILWVSLLASACGLCLHFLSNWLSPARNIDESELANTTKLQEALIIDLYNEHSPLSKDEGELMKLLEINPFKVGTKIGEQMEDLITRGIVATHRDCN